MYKAHAKDRIAALSAGLAITILLGEAAESFLPGWVGSLGNVSLWRHGSIFLGAWGVASAISYSLMIRAQRQNPRLHQGQEAAGHTAEPPATGLAIAPERRREIIAAERDSLAALLGGFAIMIAAWLVVLSYAPLEWLAENAAPWENIAASLAVWSVSSELIHVGIRRGRWRSSIPRARSGS
jgi:hypothetical protein